jgi:hypothetical protein
MAYTRRALRPSQEMVVGEDTDHELGVEPVAGVPPTTGSTGTNTTSVRERYGHHPGDEWLKRGNFVLKRG